MTELSLMIDPKQVSTITISAYRWFAICIAAICICCPKFAYPDSKLDMSFHHSSAKGPKISQQLKQLISEHTPNYWE